VSADRAGDGGRKSFSGETEDHSSPTDRADAGEQGFVRIAEAILRAVADLDGGRWPGVADRLCHCRQFAAVPSRHASKGDREPAKLACGSPWTRELEACSLSFWVRE